MSNTTDRIAVIGLGYVGLPLAVEFAAKRPVTGFDISKERIAALQAGVDETLEVDSVQLKSADALHYTSNPEDLAECSIFIVTVPTPIDAARRPDLEPLRKASELVGDVMRNGAIVIYESTVYPGCTEEFCVPVLEQASGMVFNKDFFVGYSPERINPGDREHRLSTIVKVTSGSTPETAQTVDGLYRSIITAGTHKAASIKVAEAAKVIENTQRDLNIALMNELAVIFNKLDIDTNSVLAAAGTKWNFLPFKPGLVGGHCIGVDPYYLTHKAQEIGYHPEVILSGRRINDNMGSYVARRIVKLMAGRKINCANARVLVLGIAFKENCPDIRNTKVVDMIAALQEFGIEADVFDPLTDPQDVYAEYNIECLKSPPEQGIYDAVVMAVAHTSFVDHGAVHVRRFLKEGGILYDIKSVFDEADVDGRL